MSIQHYLIQFLAVPLTLALAPTAHAQCTKDVECKGDRICEAGTCVAPGTRTAIPNASSQPASENHLVSIGRALEDQLKCAQNPEPHTSMRAMRTHGVVRNNPEDYTDGIPTFAVVKPVHVFGFQVLKIRGWLDNGDPLFKRLPVGTAPPNFVEVVVRGEVNAVTTRLTQELGGQLKRGKYNVSREGSNSTITCWGSY